jgi:hypothetical protein
MSDLGRIDSSNELARVHMEQSQKLRQARINVTEEAIAVQNIERIEEKKSTRQDRRKSLRDKKKNLKKKK